MPKTKFKRTTVKAHAIVEDDRIKVGGKMYQVCGVLPASGFGNPRLMINLRPLNVDNNYEDIRLFVAPMTKIRIYNQK